MNSVAIVIVCVVAVPVLGLAYLGLQTFSAFQHR